jgi:hypothetical protein
MKENPANAGFLGCVRRGRVASSDLQNDLIEPAVSDVGQVEPKRPVQMLSNTRAQSSIMVSQPGVICTTTSS